MSSDSPSFNDPPGQAHNPDESIIAEQFSEWLRAFQQPQQEQQPPQALSIPPVYQMPSAIAAPASSQVPHHIAMPTLGTSLGIPLSTQQPEVSQAMDPTSLLAHASAMASAMPTSASSLTPTTNATRRLSILPSRSRVFGRGMTERQQFLIFVKILLKYVDRTNNPLLRRTAKAVVAECTRRNRNGEPDYIPLQAAVERQLRATLGEMHWSRAKLCFDTYLARQGIRTVSVPPPNVTAISAV